MKNSIMLSAALVAGIALGGCSARDNFAPVDHMSYAPNDAKYVRYVTGFTGTDTHKFKTGDRSFVMRGTPPLLGVIEPWYDWNDMGSVSHSAVAFDDCGKCTLAMGAEAMIATQNLAGHSVRLEICYEVPGATEPACFAGEPLKLNEDAKDWKKLSVTAPFDKFRKIGYKTARIRLAVDRGSQPEQWERTGKTGFEGVIWADDFHFIQADQTGTDNYNVKLSGALWPDDYEGWNQWDDTETRKLNESWNRR